MHTLAQAIQRQERELAALLLINGALAAAQAIPEDAVTQLLEALDGAEAAAWPMQHSIRQQLKLNDDEFRKAIDGTLSREDYIAILKRKGIIEDIGSQPCPSGSRTSHKAGPSTPRRKRR